MNLLQIMPTDTAQSLYNAAAETESVTMNAFELALKGGWLMIVLLILLLMTIYVLIERTLVINKAAKEDNSFMNRIKDYIHDGKIDATSLCRTPIPHLLEWLRKVSHDWGDLQGDVGY